MNDGTWTYTWQHGRQLASMTKLDGSVQWSFTYNADGMRTQRTNGTNTYKYTYLGGQLTHMTVDGHTMYLAYDAAGVPMSLTYDGTIYYYVTNLQGDVVAILDNTGVEVVTYSYDAWGNLLSTTGTLATSVGFYNPLHYRGYVYDEETGLYYLQSRYYNPEMGRFINADGLVSTGQGVLGNNMFAYCGNNPVARIDSTGCGWLAILGAMALGAVVNTGITYLVSWASGEQITGWDIGISVTSGALGGLGAGGAAIGGAISGIYEGIKTYKNTGNVGAAFVGGVISFASTFVTVGNISELAELGIDALAQNAADVVFGIGSSFISAGVSKISNSLSTPPQSSKKPTLTIDTLKGLSNNQYTRIWNGKIYELGKNCGIPGYMFDGTVRIYCYVSF